MSIDTALFRTVVRELTTRLVSTARPSKIS
jgi:hypothetical protein